MGVITTCRLDEGTAYGPVPPTMTLADPIVLIGHRTCDTLPDIHTVKVRSALCMLINFSAPPYVNISWLVLESQH